MLIHGKILLGNTIVTAGMKIEDGKIVEISKQISGKKLKGIIMPAGIDVHVHLRDFDESHKETIRNGTLSALNGGICLVVDQPNSRPFIDSEEMYEKRMRLASKFVNVDYSLNIGLTRRNFPKINSIAEKIKKNGYNPAVGEIFLQHENKDVEATTEMVEKVTSFSTIHAELPEFVESNEIPNFLHRKREAEILAVKKLASEGRYFCHISTREAFETIREKGAYAEVTPHHLLLDASHHSRLGNFVNVNPPLRTENDRKFLLDNFSKIDVVASDHAPHSPEEKENGASGYPGVETLYPLLMGLVFYGKLDIFDVAKVISENPAEIFGFNGYGAVKPGNYANLAVFDISKVEKIKPQKLHYFHKWSPFESFPAVFPHTVILRGEFAKERGELAEGFGRVYKTGTVL
ncbi:dihydroorotase [Geoglobus acetivorans]|uniref:Dihydroorotase n=1 Tax=Geoglobus acetivorans TaxID=565033 RepID=A0A0A7GB89_GEOAI|nr:Dihydroorotase [Geoglobus acetivorans]